MAQVELEQIQIVLQGVRQQFNVLVAHGDGAQLEELDQARVHVQAVGDGQAALLAQAIPLRALQRA